MIRARMHSSLALSFLLAFILQSTSAYCEVTPAASSTHSGVLDLCFSPDGGCDQKIIKFVNNANSTIDMAIYSISLNGLVDAIIKLKKSGIKIRMVVDKLQAHGKFSAVDHLKKSGIPIKYGNVTGIMHNKFTIIDGKIMETGSYNYSSNASDYNAENQIYLDDSTVIKEFSDRFEALWKDGIEFK